MLARIAAALFVVATMPVNAQAFSFTFDWGDIPLCTSGRPNVVDNPVFTLKGVPAGTAEVRFHLTDLDVPAYNHGGGTVAYGGDDTVGPGAFTYNSPCPPGGHHTYEWTATALGADGRALASATARRVYP